MLADVHGVDSIESPVSSSDGAGTRSNLQALQNPAILPFLSFIAMATGSCRIAIGFDAGMVAA